MDKWEMLKCGVKGVKAKMVCRVERVKCGAEGVKCGAEGVNEASPIVRVERENSQLVLDECGVVCSV